MVMFIIQSAILLAIAFVAGCIVGCLAHRVLAPARARPAATSAPALQAPAPALEPPAAAPEPAPPAAAPGPAAAPAPAGEDDLKKIRGIGRQAEAKLRAEGITSFAQIAAWSAKDQREWGEKLAFRGRIEREKWVSQAKVLARGGKTEFSRRVEKGKVPTSARAGARTGTSARKTPKGRPRKA